MMNKDAQKGGTKALLINKTETKMNKVRVETSIYQEHLIPFVLLSRSNEIFQLLGLANKNYCYKS